jgi:hypothetical protein
MVARRGFDDADTMMVSALRNDTAHALTTLQRYAATIQRAAFRALDQLLALRTLEARAARDLARRNEPNSDPPGPATRCKRSPSEPPNCPVTPTSLIPFIPPTPPTPFIPRPPRALP